MKTQIGLFQSRNVVTLQITAQSEAQANKICAAIEVFCPQMEKHSDQNVTTLKITSESEAQATKIYDKFEQICTQLVRRDLNFEWLKNNDN